MHNRTVLETRIVWVLLLTHRRAKEVHNKCFRMPPTGSAFYFNRFPTHLFFLFDTEYFYNETKM
jgi:hypothetical protein